MTRNTTTITIQVAIRTPEGVRRVIVGLTRPTRSGAGGGAPGGSLKDGAVLDELLRDREGLRGTGAVVGERFTIRTGWAWSRSIILCAPAFRHPGATVVVPNS